MTDNRSQKREGAAKAARNNQGKMRDWSGKRWYKSRAVSKALPALTDKTLRKQGFAVGALTRQWKLVIGQDLAEDCMPIKLGFPKGSAGNGQLTLRVVSAAAAVRIQHLELMIIQRVNRFLGYTAISRIKLIQGPLGKPEPVKPLYRPTRALDESGKQRLDHLVKADQNNNLNEALRRLGAAILAEESPSEER